MSSLKSHSAPLRERWLWHNKTGSNESQSISLPTRLIDWLSFDPSHDFHFVDQFGNLIVLDWSAESGIEQNSRGTWFYAFLGSWQSYCLKAGCVKIRRRVWWLVTAYFSALRLAQIAIWIICLPDAWSKQSVYLSERSLGCGNGLTWWCLVGVKWWCGVA